jgi:hypothetical protein
MLWSLASVARQCVRLDPDAGLPGEVQLSSSSYELIRHMFECEPRGKVAVKVSLELLWTSVEYASAVIEGTAQYSLAVRQSGELHFRDFVGQLYPSCQHCSLYWQWSCICQHIFGKHRTVCTYIAFIHVTCTGQG